jgi:hypothetical protein
MTLDSIIPSAHIFPELKTYQCSGCGNRRTVEREADLVSDAAKQVAA